MGNIIEITNIDHPELAVFTKLTEAQLRNRMEPQKGVFIAESPKVIHSALNAGCRPKALLMERRHLEGQGKAIMERCPDVPVYTGDREILSLLTGYELTRGILCAMERPRCPELAEVCAGARRIAILEDIVDTTNLGAIFRSAAALNVDGILLTPSCADPLNRRAVRVSMGTVFQIPWCYLETWPHPGMDRLQAMGFRTAAMALSADAISVDNPELTCQEKLAIILGTEGTGLSRQTIEASDYTVCIPMAKGVDSLNVAAASAVAFWELRVR